MIITKHENVENDNDERHALQHQTVVKERKILELQELDKRRIECKEAGNNQ